MFSELNPKNYLLSSYQPSVDVIALTKDFRDAFGKGVNILNRSFEELNNYSVIDRENKDQRTFNSFVDESTDDPMEAWKWKGTRSMPRDKALDMHAHLTSTLAVPMAFAQNERQEEDRQMSNVMRDVLEWMAVNSEYRESYTSTMMGILYSPAKWLGAEWVESYLKIKERNEDGSITPKEVLDEELSGFRAPVYSVDQVLITNVYEQNVQRQYIIIKRVYKPHSDARSRWEWHENWNYVTAGVKTIYSDEDGLFYDIKDDEHGGLVEEAVGYCRQTDTEVTFINGIYMGTPVADENPMRHRDNFNIPKVPLTAFGYERINEHFFYWKSLMNRVGWDGALLDAMYENTMNRETLDLYTPMGVYGVEDFNSQIVFPGSVVAFENPEAEARPLIPRNQGAGYQAIREIEKSITDKTLSETLAGQLPDASQKAFSVARAEQNSRTILRGMLRSVAFSMIRYGDLMKDIGLQHLTTAQLDEITGAEQYRTLVLKDQMVGGKQVSKKLIFDDGLVGRQMSEKEKKDMELRMLSDIGWPKNKEHVYRINPHLFSKLKYLIRIEPDEMIERNSAFESQMAERMYALLRKDPLVSSEGIVRKVLNANYRGEADELIAEQPEPLAASPLDLEKIAPPRQPEFSG